MYQRDYGDITGGALLSALGVSVAVYATQHYSLGTLTRMGPGMFPIAIGYLLILLGAIIMLPAFFRAGEFPSIKWRPIVACLLAVFLFGFLIERVGIAFTILALSCAAVLADNKLGVKGAAALGVSLAAIGVFVFGYALGINAPWFAWRI